MSKNKEETFQEVFLNVCEDGYLKKGFRVVMENIQIGCYTGVKTISYSFKSNFIDTFGKRYILNKESTSEKEILCLYTLLEDAVVRKEKKLKEEIVGNYRGSNITLFYYNKILYNKRLSAQYRFESLDSKLIRYVNNDKYTSCNSLDVSYINQDAFTVMGRLKKDYKLTIEYGMNTKKGTSVFDLYTLLDNDVSYICTAKLINTLERILRYQKDIYKEKKNSLIYLHIDMYYKDNIIFERKFMTFNTDIVNREPLPFNAILSRLIGNRRSIKS